jgi:hypothetical protein
MLERLDYEHQICQEIIFYLQAVENRAIVYVYRNGGNDFFLQTSVKYDIALLH